MRLAGRAHFASVDIGRLSRKGKDARIASLFFFYIRDNKSMYEVYKKILMSATDSIIFVERIRKRSFYLSIFSPIFKIYIYLYIFLLIL